MCEWRKVCEGCTHINQQEPNQHCYMFRDAPEGFCAQNTKVQQEAKASGKMLNIKQLSELDFSKL